ncbi:MAG: hypothetical protein IKL51_00080 [Lachnospiraceae bacterium]|nr:hypothetical protein [Lachnospiraceae bacterium]
MGRNGKNFKIIHFKCEKERYEELEYFKNKYNEKYNEKLTITRLLEVAIFEFFEHHKNEIE